MEEGFQIFLVLLAVLAAVALLARKLDMAPAILLLVAGIGLAFIPRVPRLELPPDLVLLLMLPPLIYSASVAMSWRDFKANLRPIALLARSLTIWHPATHEEITLEAPPGDAWSELQLRTSK